MLKLKKSFSAHNKRDLLFAILLITPALAVLLLLSIYPLIYSITISLQIQTSDGVKWSVSNFTRLFSDSFFLTAMVHTLIYAASALFFEFLIGLILALLLNSQIRGRSIFRATLLVPMMLPTVVVGVVWRLMLNPNFGAINGNTYLDRFSEIGIPLRDCS
jgi:multiple sugar transport system permease protein